MTSRSCKNTRLYSFFKETAKNETKSSSSSSTATIERRIPGRTAQQGKGRVPEIPVISLKQYSWSENFRLCTVPSAQIPVLPGHFWRSESSSWEAL